MKGGVFRLSFPLLFALCLFSIGTKVQGDYRFGECDSEKVLELTDVNVKVDIMDPEDPFEFDVYFSVPTQGFECAGKKLLVQVFYDDDTESAIDFDLCDKITKYEDTTLVISHELSRIPFPADVAIVIYDENQKNRLVCAGIDLSAMHSGNGNGRVFLPSRHSQV